MSIWNFSFHNVSERQTLFISWIYLLFSQKNGNMTILLLLDQIICNHWILLAKQFRLPQKHIQWMIRFQLLRKCKVDRLCIRFIWVLFHRINNQVKIFSPLPLTKTKSLSKKVLSYIDINAILSGINNWKSVPDLLGDKST